MIIYTSSFTKKADKDEADIYNYITENFGEIYAEKFRKKFIEFCYLLTRYPFISRPAKNDATLRVFIFNKRNKVVYKIEDNNVTIIRILNTKTNLSSKF